MSLRTQFLDRHPEYAATDRTGRAAGVGIRSARCPGVVYLDYTGGGLHGDSQVREHADLLGQTVFGNPHSASPSSTAMTHAVERARAKVLDYFNATGEYTAVFTLNASGALKLVGEAYPFAPGGALLLTVDNHNSVNGIREFARAQGRARRLRAVDRARVAHRSAAPERSSAQPIGRAPNLFALPGAVEFLRREASARAGGRGARRADGTCCWTRRRSCRPTVSTSRVTAPDFVAISFYKMFGYPTGVGCLLIRDAALPQTRASVVRRRHREFRHRPGTTATCWRRARPGSRTAR